MIELPVPTSTWDRFAAVICHGVFLAGFPVIGPAVILVLPIIGGVASPYSRQQAWQSLVFQLIVTAVFALCIAAAVSLGLVTAFQAAAQGEVPEKSALWGIGAALVGCVFLLWAFLTEALALVAGLRGRSSTLPFVRRLGM